MRNTFKIGGKIIGIDSVYSEIHDMCREYECSGSEDISIVISRSDIDYERRKSALEDEKNGIKVRNFSDSYLETLAVYRKIAEAMTEYGTLLFHGSAIAVNGAGYLFTAKSGTGKSTHTRLWREYLGSSAVMVNDDKPLLQITENGVVVHGTPWDGKHHLSSNISVPLKAICILTKSGQNIIERISRTSAYPMLLQQTYRPNNSSGMLKTLKILDKISDNIALYKLGCNMDIEAAEIAYNAMKG